MKLRKVITTAGFMFAGVSSANAQLYMCQSCPAGTYSDGTFTECKNCSTGTYSSAGASSCTNCLTTGVSACDSKTGKATSCKPGYGLSNGTCTICPAGQYSAGGTASCTKCAKNTYSAKAGATSCTSCSTDTYSSEGSSSCKNIEWELYHQWLNHYIELPAGRYKFETSGAGGGGGGSTGILGTNGYGANGGNGFKNSVILDFNTTKRVWCYGGLKGLAGAGDSLCIPAFSGTDGADSWIKVTSTSCGIPAELCDGTNYAYAKGGAGGKGGVCGKTQPAASSGTGASGGARGKISAGIGYIGSDGTNGWCRIYKIKVTSTSTTTNPPTKR